MTRAETRPFQAGKAVTARAAEPKASSRRFQVRGPNPRV